SRPDSYGVINRQFYNEDNRILSNQRCSQGNFAYTGVECIGVDVVGSVGGSNNDSDAFDSEDEIISLTEDDNPVDSCGAALADDGGQVSNSKITHSEDNEFCQRQQLGHQLPSHITCHHDHHHGTNEIHPHLYTHMMIGSHSHTNPYYIPNFINQTTTTLESQPPVVITTTTTTATSDVMHTRCYSFIGQDDGEISSVSQSASQIVPNASSSPSSSSSSPSSSSKDSPSLSSPSSASATGSPLKVSSQQHLLPAHSFNKSPIIIKDDEYTGTTDTPASMSVVPREAVRDDH
ncbi:unnamed protein product, partial [Trichobilharzia regenti]